MKKFMSTKMKIFISVLATIFIGSYIIAAIVLFNSDYKLINYIDNLPFSIDADWDDFGFDIDWDSNYSKYYDSRDLGINSDLSSINIDTTSSDINIQFYDNTNVKLNIESKVKHNANFDSLIDRFIIENNTLYISTNESFLNFVKNLKLTIYIPNTYKNDLSIGTTSGDISISNTNLNNLNINSTSSDIELNNVSSTNSTISTTSGDIDLSNVNFTSSNIKTSSGDISSNSSLLGNTQIETTSGEIELHLNDIGTNNTISSTSGDVELSIPSDIGYTLSFNTVSGDLSTHNGIETNNGIKNFVNGDGNKTLNISTVSGDLEF